MTPFDSTVVQFRFYKTGSNLSSINHIYFDEDPAHHYGINPGEELFMWFFGVTYDNVITDLANGDLRIGLHVQGIGSEGQSDSFVNGPPGTPPEPPP